jgi:predicted nucleic acid-binding protein
VILVDTNILVRSVYPPDPHYEIAARALSTLTARNEILCIAPQNIIEFWAVATRPRNENGLGLESVTAEQEIEIMMRLFLLLAYTPQVFHTWRHIVFTQGVLGKQTHDAHLVALMQVHAVESILTFNSSHFKRYSGINVLDPAQV